MEVVEEVMEEVVVSEVVMVETTILTHLLVSEIVFPQDLEAGTTLFDSRILYKVLHCLDLLPFNYYYHKIMSFSFETFSVDMVHLD